AVAAKALAVHGKSLEPAAFDRIADLTGPDPGSFAAAVDKSALFAAGRTRITEDDALEVVSRSREDPIYMFTGALAEKDQDLALYYLDSLLFAGFHHAQILSAMANFIRRLSAVKGFVNSHEGGQWKPGMPFEAFKKQVMPAVTEHDRQLLQFEEKIGGALGSAGRTDTVLAKNPNSLYPVYQNFIQAGRFCAEELDSIIDLLHRADLNLKTTGYSARNVIEQAIFEICRKPGKNTGTEDFSYSR
ncbi:MAG: DNA polymerase III subunit delta, partial [Desulfosalsimonas sp.]